MSQEWSSIAVIAIAVVAFTVADFGGGSGFIATFMAGLSYGNATRDRIKPNDQLATNLGQALVQVSFLVFGAIVLSSALDNLTWQVVLMAVLALTIARMGPVLLSMIGTGLAKQTILYLGWFGPRGLATIVFAALVVTEAQLDGIETITTVAAVTVGMSVIAHGVTSYAGSQRYADWYGTQDITKTVEAKPVDHALRRRFRKSDSSSTPPQAD
jgi:NhaP-type Na+/H+ or K+/H+ antiporter